MRRRLRRRYGRIFGRKPEAMQKYLVYKHGEFLRSVSLPKSMGVDAARRSLVQEFGQGIDIEEVR